MKKRFITLSSLLVLPCLILVGCLPQDLKQKFDVNVNGADDLSVTEGGGGASITMYLSAAPNADVVFDITSSDETELLLSGGNVSEDKRVGKISLTFTNATWFNPQRINIYGADDNVIDGTQRATVRVEPAVSDDDRFNGLDPKDFLVSNEDNDSANIIFEVLKPGSSAGNPEYDQIQNINTSESSTGLSASTDVEGNATFFVSLLSQPESDVEFVLFTTRPSEALIGDAEDVGLVTNRKLTFTPETWNARQSVTVVGQDDFRVDGDIHYNIVVTAVSSDDSNYNGIDSRTLSASNKDDDIAAFTIQADHPLLVQASSGLSTQFSVVLDAQPESNVIIDVSSNDATLGQFVDPENPGLTVDELSLEFTPDNWNVAQTATLLGVNNEPASSEAPFYINVGPSQSTDANFRQLRNLDVEVFELGNSPNVFFYPKRNLISSENNRAATFQARLTTQPSDEVTLSLNSKNPDEGLLRNANGDPEDTIDLIFDQNNWDTFRSISIVGRDDSVIDKEQAVNISPQINSDDIQYNGLSIEDVVARNADDDAASYSILYPPSLVTADSGEMSFIGIRLNKQPTSDVLINVNVSLSVEAQLAIDFSKNYSFRVPLTFKSTQWATPQYVYITGVSDQQDDGDKEYELFIDVDDRGTDDTEYSNLPQQKITFTSLDDD